MTDDNSPGDVGAVKVILDDLYGAQREAADRIIGAVHNASSRPHRFRSERAGDDRLDVALGTDPEDFDRPHQTYVIDGERGSGKTSVLLSIFPYLNMLSAGGPREPAPGMDATRLQDLNRLGLRSLPAETGGDRAALVLPVVFTEDMEVQETTMEAVFAMLDRELEDRGRATKDEARRASFARLRRLLRTEVGVAWTYSRKFGSESLANDAMDYADFVDRRADVGRKAYNKIIIWRRFLTQCLDELGHRTMVLLFDDSDLSPALAEDMVRAIRMYLSHPQVVSVVAVDLRTLERMLITNGLAQHRILANAASSQFYSKLDDARERIVELETANTLALMDKVLPRRNRMRLTLRSPAALDHFFRPDTFASFCADRSELCLDPKNRMAWWLLNNPYRTLMGQNVRWIVGFKQSLEKPDDLLVQLLRKPELHDLAALCNEDLTELRAMIERGDFETASQNLEGDLSDEDRSFIDLVVDSDSAAGGLRLAKTRLARSWLALPSTAAERVASFDAGLIGVAGILPRSLLPRNCLYVHEFRHLERALGEYMPPPSPLAAGLEKAKQTGLGDGIAAVARFTRQTLDHLPTDAEKQALSAEVKKASRIALGFSSRNVAGREPDENLEDPAGPADDVLARDALSMSLMFALVADVARDRGPARQTVTERVGWALEALAGDVSQVTAPFATFTRALADALPEWELRRRESLVLWACAVQIANIPTSRPGVRRVPSVLIPTWGSVRGEEGTSRLEQLVDATLNGRDPRPGLLLAVATCPLLPPLIDFGEGYAVEATPRDAWSRLAEWLETRAAEFEEVLASAELRRKMFPDIDENVLRGMAEEVGSAAASIRAATAVGDIAGTPPSPSARKTPSGRLAGLLGVSQRWVRDHLGV